MASSKTKENKQCGLIILGNSGVGKSFLANILLKEEAFLHQFSARSVTHETDFREITFNGTRFAIFDIPGLIEADQARIDLNKREIDHAFQQRPNSVVVYVFGQQNGRIRDEDVVAFNAINAAYSFDHSSLTIAMNGLPADLPPGYQGEVVLILKDLIEFPITGSRVCFLNQINRQNVQEKENLRNQLLRFVVESTPTEYQKIQDIHLSVDEVPKLKNEIKKLTEAFEADKLEKQEKIREQQKIYDDFVTDSKTEKDHLNRVIERQRDDARIMCSSAEQQAKQIQAMHQEQERLRTQVANLQSISLAAFHDCDSDDDSSCFIAGTQIRMADGTQKSIENIQIGDLVLGINDQCHHVIFLDTELLNHRLLYSINGSQPFFTSEHVFLTNNGKFVSVDPQASEVEEPSLRHLVHPLTVNVHLQSFQQTSILVQQCHGVEFDSNTTVYNIVLDSGHLYYANDFAVFDMFPNLSLYPRMFKFLHLLWRKCATEIDDQFDDVTTPNSIDRLRLESLAQVVQQTISDLLSKKKLIHLNSK